MAFDPKVHSGRLRRLAPGFYQGKASVHWTMTIRNRATGWLDPGHHATVRELLCHALIRERLVCPTYCLMADHAHFLWSGCSDSSDQPNAVRRFRTSWNRLLAPLGVRLDVQAFDHVLSDRERERSVFAATCDYILRNPVRAGLAEDFVSYPFLGCVVPGYPELDPRMEDFWGNYWHVYPAALARFGG